MSQTDTQTERGPQKVTSAAALKKRAIHEGVTLPSGAIVDIRLPNLQQMIAAGAVPNDLVDSAIQAAKQPDRTPTVEDIKNDWSFTRFIVPKALVKPKIEEADVEELDAFDLDLLLALIARRTDIDAVGHQLGGLDTQQSFRDHRGILSVDEVVGGLAGDGEGTA